MGMFNLSGKGKPIIDGVLAGAVGQLATNYIGGYGHPVSALAVGFIRNNPVLLTEGSRGLGAMLASNFIGGNSGSASQI
jgi:hypothetical protein